MGTTDFRILGPLEVAEGDRRLPLAGVKQRALLAILLVHAGEAVSTDRLIDELWGDGPPDAGGAALTVSISRLRRVLGAAGELLVTQSPGYAMLLAPGQLDAQRFERLVESGAAALAAGDAPAAAERLSEALALWRGSPLADFSYQAFARPTIARLEELRLATIELRAEAQLALGDHARLIGDLQALVVEHPLRERLWEQLMLALYRDGRQAEALEAYRAARRMLVDEIGLEPGPGLHDLERRILAQDQDLVSPTAPRATRTARALGPLPTPPNRTIGRERDVGDVSGRLRSGRVRLLTLTGPGGVGKTRLAIEAACTAETSFADGAGFVSLAALLRSGDVPAAIADGLGIVVLAGESAQQAVERFLAAKEALIVLDNLEHLPEAAPYVAGLLTACPQLTILATSREPLTLQAEERYPLSPLALPMPGDDPAAADAVALFCERARAHDPKFELRDANPAAVADICRRVDGLPLAIELAAARCGLLSPAEIAERLDAALGAPGAGARDAPGRHRTLRATVDWSHQLLSDGEKACFARFAVFSGGATIEAAETITGTELDTLDHLVAKSLLVRRREAHTATRLDMLETIRTYAAERFAAAAEGDVIRERHYRHFLAVAERDGDDQALMGVGHKHHLACLDEESHNLDAALRWAIGQPDAGPALAMVAALLSYWDLRDRHTDAVHWIDRALTMPGAEDHPSEHARALVAKAFALKWSGQTAEQPAILARAQAVARPLGDPLLLAKVLNGCSACWAVAGRSDTADMLADEALRCATSAGDKWEIAQAWTAKASAVSTLSELRDRVNRAASLLEDVGNVVRLGQLFCDAAYGALAMGGDSDARQLADRAAPIVWDLDNPGSWMLLRGNTGLVALLTGDTDAARDAFHEELEICRDLVALPIASEGFLGLAAVAVVDGDLSHAARLRGAAAAHSYGQQQDSVEARLEEAFFATARKRHGANAWDIAVRTGTQLSFENAIAYALDEQSAQSTHTASTA